MSEEVVKAQIEQIRFLMRQVEKLKKEKAVLEAALTRQTIEAGKSFHELRNQFDQLAQDLYELIVYWTKRLKRGVTYDEIIRYYRIKHPNTNYQAETITRRVREIAERGWLHSPIRGTFIPVPKEEKQ